MSEKKYIALPANDAVQNWFEENIDKECSASSAVYKFRLWLESLQTSQARSEWVKASERLPQIVDKKCKPRFVKVQEKRHDGSLRITKAVAYYFPEHFKTVEWEDWDDYSEEDFPYTESDEEKGVVWLRAPVGIVQ